VSCVWDQICPPKGVRINKVWYNRRNNSISMWCQKKKVKMANVCYGSMVSVVLLYFTIKNFVIENASALGQRLHGSVGTGLCQSRVHCPLLC
jgi:hypothetical protein